jgi:hypothetical protein
MMRHNPRMIAVMKNGTVVPFFIDDFRQVSAA